MPLRNSIIFCSDCFHRLERYRLADAAIFATIQQFPSNTEISQILTKVVLINALYGTTIYNTLKISKHILGLNFDNKVQVGDLSIIDDIRTEHGIHTTKGSERNVYAFATKYTSCHAPDIFPVFDNLVKKLLKYLNTTHNFHETFTQKDLHDYALFKNVVDSLITYLNLPDFRYKQIDQGMWIYAKYKYDRNKLPEDITHEIDEAVIA